MPPDHPIECALGPGASSPASCRFAVDPVRRLLIVAGPLLAAMGQVAAQTAAPAEPPRLKYRSRRAVCECNGDTDDAAIERAAEKLKGKEPAARSDGNAARPDKATASPSPPAKPASDGASQTDGKPGQDNPTTRRQTP
jgi:hypothetical protein